MNNFEDNLTVISQRNVPHFIAEIESCEDALCFMGTDIDGVKVFCDKEGTPFIIEPTIDVTQLPNPQLKQIIFFFGIASFEEILEIAKNTHKESLFIIIEPNPYLMQYAMHNEEFRRLNHINYIIVTEKPNKLTNLFKLIFSSKFFYLTKNISFYLDSYYRKYNGRTIKEYIKEIGTAIKNKYFNMGNSIHDSLIGLINNLNNIKKISENIDVARLKNAFSGVPAFVVAAGPSLDKNISDLKNAQGKGIIVAVDTIAQKLINSGIIPDFICTVERGAIVWEYFYENQKYPTNTFLVSSLVADPRIIEKFDKKVILPMRSGVREYFWFGEKLGLTKDHYMWMGASCAHLAMGLALHVGASPIVMVGQDLAYGDKGTHAGGTVYDQKPIAENQESLWVEGYYGKQVRTRKIWLEFKQIFENMIQNINVPIINATEGGAKINGAIQKNLVDVLSEYCNDDCNVYETLRNLPKTNLDWNNIESRIVDYVQGLEEYRRNVADHLSTLRDFKEIWQNNMPEKKVKKIYKVMKKTDQYYKAVNQDQLLYHNIQGPLTVLIQKFHTIEEAESLESLKQNLLVQIELCEMIENTAWLITQVFRENFPWSDSLNEDKN